MGKRLQQLETASEKTEFAEQVHSDSSNQEAETISEKTELADQSSSKKSSQGTETKYLASRTKRLLY